MFAVIKPNGATLILINIPHEGAEKSLPALAAMLEKNAVFINEGYRESTTVKPEMEIRLGDTFSSKNSEAEIMVTGNGGVISEDFKVAEPQVFVSHKEFIKSTDKKLADLRTELEGLKLANRNLADENRELRERLVKIGNPELETVEA